MEQIEEIESDYRTINIFKSRSTGAEASIGGLGVVGSNPAAPTNSRI
jgi:hypothetical protein